MSEPDLAIIIDPLEKEEENEESIQAKPKVKKPRTQAQIEATEKMLLIRKDKCLQLNNVKNLQKIEDKKKLDLRILKKAKSLEIKQKKEEIILAIQDDEDDEIQVVTKKIPVPEKTKLVIKFI